MTTHRARIARRSLLGAPLLLARPAFAQAWPARPVRIVVPFGPGGPTDVMARTVANGLTAALGQPFLVENRPGAGGNVGVLAVARSAPDGYTLLVSSSGFVVNTSLFRNPGYDAVRDFTPIMELGASPNAFLATNASPIRTVADLVAKARETPDGMPSANPGTGSTPHLTSELLHIRTGVNFIQIAHNSAPAAVQAVVSATTEIGVTALASGHAQIKGGLVRALALTGTQRWFDLPDVPTMGEIGFADFVSETFQGFFAPAGTSQAIVDRLAREGSTIMAVPETQARLRAAGFAMPSDPTEALRRRVAREVPMWRDVIERAGIERQ